MNSDPISPIPRAPTPRFVAGVYNYCDHWCERCRFQRRCRLRLEMRRLRAQHDEPLDAAAAAALAEDERRSEAELEEDAASVPASESAEFLAMVEEANQEPTPEERARIDATVAAFDRRRKRQRSHPLSLAAEDYAHISEGLMNVLRPTLESRGDSVALAALETIDRFDLLIHVKTIRATGCLVADRNDEDDGDDDEFMRTDGNGCAKLVRLMVAESREAWEVLMQLSDLAADGVPAAMVRRLEEFDDQLAAAFPNAMTFVRPGFDEEEET